MTTSSVLYDSVYLPGGKDSVAILLKVPEVMDFVQSAYRHGKAIAASNEGIQVLEAALRPARSGDGQTQAAVSRPGVVTALGQELDPFFEAFASAMADHRHYSRGIVDEGTEVAPRAPSTAGNP
jgi:catalase